MKIWERAGRLIGPTPLLVTRRGRVRPQTREEAAAALEAAIAALDAAGVPVRVVNIKGYALVLIKGGRWINEENDTNSNHRGSGANRNRVQLEQVRTRVAQHADAHQRDGN